MAASSLFAPISDGAENCDAYLHADEARVGIVGGAGEGRGIRRTPDLGPADGGGGDRRRAWVARQALARKRAQSSVVGKESAWPRGSQNFLARTWRWPGALALTRELSRLMAVERKF